jgi:hypothetical protein
VGVVWNVVRVSPEKQLAKMTPRETAEPLAGQA